MNIKKYIVFFLIISLLVPSFIGIFWTSNLYAFSGLKEKDKENLFSLAKGLVMLFLLNKIATGEVPSEEGSDDGVEPDQRNPSEQNSQPTSEGPPSSDNDTSKTVEKPPVTDDSNRDWTETEVTELTAAEEKMLKLLNQERKKRGLNPLKVDMRLVKVARAKSRDMIKNDYFAHQSPELGSPFDMIKKVGIDYQFAGENIAGGPTVEKAHQALMNSPGHRENILRPRYTHVGIGVIDGGQYGMMFSQEFIDINFDE